MLQCWEGSEVAVLSEGVDDTWYCEELIVFKEVSWRVEQTMLQCWEGSGVAVLSEGVVDTW